MTSLTIRRAALQDIPLIMKMSDEAFRATYAELLSPEQIDFMMDWMYSEESLRVQIAGEGKFFFIAECDGIPCGYCSVEREGTIDDGTPKYHFQKLYALPAWQGKGIGKAMFRHIVDFVGADAAGPYRMVLNVNRYNSRAVAFYERQGMKRIFEGDFDIGHGFLMTDYIYCLERA